MLWQWLLLRRCSTNVNEASLNIGYSEDNLSNAPTESNMGLGCGNPLAIASLKEGEVVLDLGSGGALIVFWQGSKLANRVI